MTNGEVADLMYKVFIMALQLGGPVLVVSMAVGIIISILQAATQIHEPVSYTHLEGWVKMNCCMAGEYIANTPEEEEKGED